MLLYHSCLTKLEQFCSYNNYLVLLVRLIHITVVVLQANSVLLSFHANHEIDHISHHAGSADLKDVSHHGGA